MTLVNLADLQLDPESTVRYASEALEVASRIKALDVSSAASGNLGDAALAIGDVAAAAAHYISAIDGYATIGDDLGQADVIGLIGALAIESNPVAAARLIGAAQSVYVRNDVLPTSPQAMRVAASQNRLRSLLGLDEFERARAAGHGVEPGRRGARSAGHCANGTRADTGDPGPATGADIRQSDTTRARCPSIDRGREIQSPDRVGAGSDCG